MNNRDYKKFAPNTISHVYNRGNNKEIIFRDEEDYRAFLFRLALALGFDKEDLKSNNIFNFPHSRIRITPEKIGSLKLHAFCLMPNHFHLLIEQVGETSISKFLSRVFTSFSKFINLKYKRVGHVFQDEFKAVPVESNPQLMWNSAYIHMNPVVANLVDKPEDYLWSSYNTFAGNVELPIISKDLIPELFGTKEKFIKETYKISNDDPLSMGTFGF